jgi:hypothetical protein
VEEPERAGSGRGGRGRTAGGAVEPERAGLGERLWHGGRLGEQGGGVGQGLTAAGEVEKNPNLIPCWKTINPNWVRVLY